MKKTILILAAIFIANNIFSQDLDSLLNETINSVNKVLVDNDEESLKIDTGILKDISETILNKIYKDNTFNPSCMELSKKYEVVIPFWGNFLSTKDNLVNETLKYLKQNNLEKANKQFGFAIYTNNHNTYNIMIVYGYQGDIKKTCYYKE